MSTKYDKAPSKDTKDEWSKFLDDMAKAIFKNNFFPVITSGVTELYNGLVERYGLEGLEYSQAQNTNGQLVKDSYIFFVADNLIKSRDKKNYQWKIDARKDIQTLKRKLYDYGFNNFKALSRRERNPQKSIFGYLAGIIFSLWRASFLSEETRNQTHMFTKSLELFDSLMEFNYIMFSQEVEQQDWMVGYYFTNAITRLKILDKKYDLQLELPENIADFDFDPPRDVWRKLYDETEKALERYISSTYNEEGIRIT